MQERSRSRTTPRAPAGAGLAVALLDRLATAHPVADAVHGVCRTAQQSGTGPQHFAAVIAAYRDAPARSV